MKTTTTYLLASLLFLPIFSSLAQINNVEEKFSLPSILNESSGVIFFNNRIISHNDSGNENLLHELDTISGTVTRTISIDNATNIDWEDITQDNTSIYIGDIGNNNGDRTDLKIYKVNKNDYINSTNVIAEVISFDYSDQTSFTPSPNNTEWDAEALVSFDSNLLLFTKNWLTGETKAYPIPKNSGTYTIDPLPTTLSSDGLITGATYNELVDKVYLVGYNSILQPFLWISENFLNNDIFSGFNTKILLSEFGFEQIEAITNIGANRYFMTSESFNISGISDNAKLMTFSAKDELLSLEKPVFDNLKLYPNPIKNELHIKGENVDSVEVYDTRSRIVFQCNCKELQISELQSGVYIVKIYLSYGRIHIRKVIKN